jgi:hypothetical protein
VIFIDSNIPMYLVGASQRHQLDTERALTRLIEGGERLVTDAEVFQEILHRYSAIKRPQAIQSAFEVLLQILDEVFPVDLTDVQRAKEILLSVSGLSARDALHAATMERHEVHEILTFDAGFDLLPGVGRISR